MDSLKYNIYSLIRRKITSKISIILLLSSLLIAPVAYAQQGILINGTVSDHKGESLPGVSVIVKGTTNGIMTDINGKFSLNIPNDKSVLVFSFIGFTTFETSVGNQTLFNITLNEDTKLLDEVVVVGYGTQKKVNLTGAVEVVDGARLAKQSVTQASQALMGLSPGLTVIQESGQPGADEAKLRIRGIGSISASNDPLILIDGVEGNINSLDVSNIQNISILKDASSSAIYGARASNGVILVTTKRAKAGEVTVSYKNYLGWQDPTNLPKFLGALDFMKYSGAQQSAIDAYSKNMATDPFQYPDTDWSGLLFSENGFQQYHNLTVSGGSEKAKVIASLGYMSQDGNVVGYGFERYNGRFNSDLKVSDKFDINFDISFNRGAQESSVYTLTYTMMEAFRLPPVYPYIYSDGSWGDGFSGANPIARVNDGGYNNRYNNDFRGIVKLNYRPISGMTLSMLYSPSYEDIYEKYASKTFEQIIDWNAKTKRKVNDPNQFRQTNIRPFTESFNATAAYTKAIKKHEFTALVGYEFVKYHFEKFQAGRQYYVLQDYEVLDAGSAEYDYNSGTASHSGLVSYFGRINYTYDSKYLFEANVRRDASSHFHPSKRVGIFPSFSAGWRLSEENFIKNLSIFSNLKLRASWGSLGNQSIGNDPRYAASASVTPGMESVNPDFPYVSSIRLGNSNYMFGDKIATGAAPEVLANKNIKWETTEIANIGIDGGFLDQRLTFSLDYYNRKTKDLLLNIPIPADIGLKAPIQNIGDVENKGWDFNLSWQDKAGDFSYGARLNLSDVKNSVTNLGGDKYIINGNLITQLGYPIGSIYGYETVGIFQTDAEAAAAPAQFGKIKAGNLQYKDQLTIDSDNDGIFDKADGKINADDRVRIGDPFPRMTYGLDLNVGYKAFDATLSMQGVGKRDVLLSGDMVLPLYNAGKIQEWHTQECWTPERPNAKFPILAPTSVGSNDNQVSDTWVFNASYLRVRNIVIGYTFPKQLLSKMHIENLRIYCSGQNLFTFDKLPEGIDPLVPNGATGAIYPITKNYTFGLELSF